MGWFETFCRNAGEVIGLIIKPVKRTGPRILNKAVEEKKVSPTVTLRRTTVEEVEVKQENAERHV